MRASIFPAPKPQSTADLSDVSALSSDLTAPPSAIPSASSIPSASAPDVPKRRRGRPKGSPNKLTLDMRTVIARLLDEYHKSGLMLKDFLALDPDKRLIIAERLMQYALPKLQATTVDLTASSAPSSIDDTLRALSQD